MHNRAHSRESGNPEGLDSRFRGNERIWQCAIFVLLAFVPTAAHAHPGDHSQFGWLGLAAHLFEPDHLIFIALMIVVGFLAFRAGRRAERQAQARRKP